MEKTINQNCCSNQTKQIHFYISKPPKNFLSNKKKKLTQQNKTKSSQPFNGPIIQQNYGTI